MPPPPLAAASAKEAAAAEAGAEAEAAAAPPLCGVGRFGFPRTIAAKRGERASSRVKVSASGASWCSSGQPGSEQVAEAEAERGQKMEELEVPD